MSPHDVWSLPGFTVASDRELAEQLCRAIDGLKLDAAAHENEHAIEVELPWLARWAPDARPSESRLVTPTSIVANSSQKDWQMCCEIESIARCS